MAIESTDEVLINRNGVTYTQQQGEIMAKIEATDLMLVNREDVTYTVTGEEFIDSVIDPLTLNISFAPNPPLCETDCTATAIPAGGKAPYIVNSYQWYVSDLVDGGNGTAIPGADTSVYTIPFGSEGKYFGCRITITDARESSVTETTYAQAAQIIEIAPLIESVTLSETPGNLDPWNSASYDVDVTLEKGTQPLTYGIRPFAKGSLSTFLETDVITDIESGGTEVSTTDTIANVNEITTFKSGIINPDDMGVDNGSAPLVAPATADISQVTWFEYPNNTSADPISTSNYPGWQSYSILDFTAAGTYQIRISGNGMAGVAHGIYTSSTGLAGSWTFVERWTMSNDTETKEFSEERYILLMRNGTSDVNEVPTLNTVVFWFYAINGIKTVLSFPTDNNFDKFALGDVAQSEVDTSSWGGPVSDTGSVAPSLSNGAILAYSSTPIAFTVEALVGNSAIQVYTSNDGVNWIYEGVTNTGGTGTSSVAKYLAAGGSATNARKISAPSNFVWTPYNDNDIFDQKADCVADIATKTSITGIDDTATPPTITVDGGRWLGADGTGDAGDGRYEPDQDWSSRCTTESGTPFQSSFPVTNAFDGDLTTVANSGSNDDIVTLDLSGLGLTGIAEVYAAFATTPGALASLTTDPQTDPNAKALSNGVWIELGDVTGADQITWWVGNNQVVISAVKINGKLLVDTSVPGGPGDTNISKYTAYNDKLTFLSDSNLTDFESGDEVVMSPEKTLTTNTIETVENSTVSIDGVVTGSPFDNNPNGDYTWARTFDTTLDASGAVGTNYKYTFDTVQNVKTVTVLSGYVSIPTAFTIYDENGTVINVTPTSRSVAQNPYPSYYLTSSSSAGGTRVAYDFTIPNGKVSAVEINSSARVEGLVFDDVPLITGQSRVNEIILNFEDTIAENPDLNLFKPGDLVQGASEVLEGQKIGPGHPVKIYWRRPSPNLSFANASLYGLKINGVEVVENAAGGPYSATGTFKQATYINDSTTNPNDPVTITNALETNAHLAFDGNGLVKDGYVGADGYIIWEPLELFEVETIEVALATGEEVGYQYIFEFDDGSFFENTPSEVNGLWSPLIFDSRYNPNPAVRVINTDLEANTMAVDGGSWLGSDGSGDTGDGRYEPSQEWSNSLSGVNLSNPENAFNGDDDYADTTGGWTLNLSPYTFGPGLHTIAVKSGGATSITVNSTPLTDPGGGGAKVWTGSVTGELTTIFTSANGASVYYIEVDGKLLVNSSVPGGLGETFVTSGPYKGTGTVLDVDVTNKEMLLSNVTNRWVEGSRAQSLQEIQVAKLYAVMQENTGKIISMTSLLPDFTDQVGQPPIQFEFPAVFPSGKTPSDTFPIGTELCVDVEVTNSAGTDIELADDSGACLQPGFKKSSGITAVSDIQVSGWNQSQVWTTSTALGSGVSTNGGEPINNIYNGETTFCRLVGGAVGVGLTLSPGSLTATKIEIKPSNGANSASEIKVNGTSYGTSTAGSEELLVADLGSPTSITSIEFLRGSGTDNYGLYYIKADDRLLVDNGIAGAPTSPGTQLTFANTTALNAFESGDAVYMCNADGNIASYKPVTSTIASVSGTAEIFQPVYGPNMLRTGWDYNNQYPLRNVFAETGYTDAWTNAQAIPSCSLQFGADSLIPEAQESLIVRMLCGVDYRPDLTCSASITTSNGIHYLADSETKGTWEDISVSQLGVIERIDVGMNGNNQALLVESITVDGLQLVDNALQTPSYPLLEFTSPNPDLQYFRAGDVVKAAGGFTPVLYTGNDATQSITGVGFSPDLVWIKNRTGAINHALFDTVRGVEKRLKSSSTDAEDDSTNGLTAFNSDGFTVGNNGSNGASSNEYVAWCWKAGDTTVTNNEGTIESQVRSNGNFSVVSYSAADNASQVGHGLSSAPSFIITKPRQSSVNWNVYHSSYGVDSFLKLQTVDSRIGDSGHWGTVDSTTFGTKQNGDNSLNDMIAYCWAETPGVSSFGKYAGSDSTTILDFGFRPAYVLIKCSSASGDWVIKTEVTGPNQYSLANSSNQESTGYNCVFTDTGIELGGNYEFMNKDGYDYIYAAFGSSEPVTVIDVDVANNEMAVDGGSWKGSDGSGDGKIWSDSPTLTGGATALEDPNNPWTNAFDGTSTEYGALASTSVIGDRVVFDTTGLLATSITMYGQLPANAGIGLIVNDRFDNVPGDTGRLQASGSPLAGEVYIDFGGSPRPINQIGWEVIADGDGPKGAYWFKADGVILVDDSDATPDTVVTASNAISGTGTFDSYTSNTADLATSNRDWVGTNSKGTTFYMKSDQMTTFMQDNPEHVAIFNAFAAAADQYSIDVNKRRSDIVGATQRLINGESLDANEAAQLLLAVAKGVNAVEPFTYDGYYPLFYTAEKALAASSMNAYHTHRFDGTDYYMPDGGTLFHGTYVTSEEVEAQHREAREVTYSSATGRTTGSY